MKKIIAVSILAILSIIMIYTIQYHYGLFQTLGVVILAISISALIYWCIKQLV